MALTCSKVVKSTNHCFSQLTLGVFSCKTFFLQRLRPLSNPLGVGALPSEDLFSRDLSSLGPFPQERADPVSLPRILHGASHLEAPSYEVVHISESLSSRAPFFSGSPRRTKPRPRTRPGPRHATHHTTTTTSSSVAILAKEQSRSKRAL